MPARRQKWLPWVACALGVVIAGYFGLDALLRRAEANLEVVEEEVAEVLVLEGDYRPPNLEHLGAQIADEWGDGVSLVELHMDMALVNVVIDQPSEAWHSEPYRVARVLRNDGKGWQLIAPTYSFWSERRTLATRYFAFDFSRRDANALDEIVDDLEASYEQLHTDLGLPAPTVGVRIPIKIVLVDGSPVRVTDLSYSGETLLVPPPELIPRPLDMSDADALRQTITYALAVKLFTDGQTQVPPPCTWNAVAEGVGLWLRWEDHTLPSRRKWIYDSAIGEWNAAGSLPRLDDLLSFPLSCSRPPSILEVEILNSGRPMPRPELASTLVDYLVTEHGRHLLPQMMDDMDEYADWDDFAQRTVDLSAAELEEAWQAYVLTKMP